MDSRLQSGTAAPARIVSPYGPQGLSSAKAQEFRVTEAGVADQMARITKNHGALSGVPRPASTASGPASASKPWMTPTELLAHVKNTQESDASSSDDDSTIADEVPDDGASFPLVVGDMSAPEELGPLHQAADGRPYIKFQGEPSQNPSRPSLTVLQVPTAHSKKATAPFFQQVTGYTMIPHIRTSAQ